MVFGDLNVYKLMSVGGAENQKSLYIVPAPFRTDQFCLFIYLFIAFTFVCLK